LSGWISRSRKSDRLKPLEKPERVTDFAAGVWMPGPIYMNEDDNGRASTPENLTRELVGFDAVFGNGGSWGYMPWRQVQMFPFRFYRPARSTPVRAEMPVEERDPAYFHAVLEHIRKAIYSPEAAAQPCKLASE